MMDDDASKRSAREAEVALLHACVAGDSAACLEFERMFAACLRGGAERVRSDVDFVAEVVQSVRVELFTGSHPRALTFCGRGPLAAWLKVVATRAALDKARSEGRERARARRAQRSSRHSTTGLERRLDLARNSGRYVSALDHALRRLSARDRNLLRLRYASGLNVDAIGIAYGVHRATAARWIANALQEVCRSVRGQLERGPDARSPSELDSALRAAESQLASALGGFLETSSSEPEPVLR